jgi:hypothetical protein
MGIRFRIIALLQEGDSKTAAGFRLDPRFGGAHLEQQVGVAKEITQALSIFDGVGVRLVSHVDQHRFELAQEIGEAQVSGSRRRGCIESSRLDQ